MYIYIYNDTVYIFSMKQWVQNCLFCFDVFFWMEWQAPHVSFKNNVDTCALRVYGVRGHPSHHSFVSAKKWAVIYL